MNCAEFQKVLPYIVETGGNAQAEEHLRDCHVCSDLVADLLYIAEQAKLLVPMEEPAPRVWEGIRGSLEREGMIQPARARGRLLGSKASLPWIGALGLLVLIAGIFLAQRGGHQSAAVPAEVNSVAAPLQTVSLSTVATEQDDEQLLQHVAASRPSSASTYQDNLQQINASIADAKKTLAQNPDDEDARQSLLRAYQQKAMVYELATRSLQ